METKKYPYTVKYFNKKGWHILPTEYLNPFDDWEQKEKEIKRIRSKNNIDRGIYINISNFNNVYC